MGSTMGVDGERMPYEAVQCYVIPRLLKLFGEH